MLFAPQTPRGGTCTIGMSAATMYAIANGS